MYSQSSKTMIINQTVQHVFVFIQMIGIYNVILVILILLMAYFILYKLTNKFIGGLVYIKQTKHRNYINP